MTDLVLWGTTIPSGSTATTTIDELEIRVYNDERYYSRTFFETLQNMSGRKRAAPGYHAAHIHQIDGAVFAQYMDTSAVKPVNHILSNHLHLPFDVNGDLAFALDAKGLSSFAVRIQAGDTNPIRVIPCEIIEAVRRM